ncbi:MAG: 1,4-dihydroxy-2-naphthoate polyprenyltransferase [Deltaproteobacteria bacterium]|nr:1,4-dihydroxy-2-naphthoate polyprenyltransferase [Deltaproteobacteria bacterium]
MARLMHSPAPGSLRAWWLASRPATWPASLAPVAVGTAVAAAEGRARAPLALACFAVAWLLQIGANFVNDYADCERGADANRLGPPRAAQSGWLRPKALRVGAAAVLLLAAALGLWLAWQGGPVILAAGALALLSAWAYTASPLRLGYRGLGDPLVFVFFGIAAVVGTHWVQAREFSVAAWFSALPVGLLAVAMLAVNNLRDREGDAASGKRTLAVRLSETGARRYTAVLIVASYAALAPVVAAGGLFAALMPIITVPLTRRVLRRIMCAEGAALSAALPGVALLQLAFAAVLCIAWLVRG